MTAVTLENCAKFFLGQFLAKPQDEKKTRIGTELAPAWSSPRQVKGRPAETSAP